MRGEREFCFGHEKDAIFFTDNGFAIVCICHCSRRLAKENMDWAAIEAIASVAGVISVVISIIFLIYEVRHNARAIEGSTVQLLMSLEREVFRLLAENAELTNKGGWEFASLPEPECYKYERVVGTYMSSNNAAFIQHERDLVVAEVWDAYVNALKRQSQAPEFAGIWEQIKEGYRKSFLREIAA